MDTSERSRKKRDLLGAREEQGSVPPPPMHRRKERHELDPENLWDSGAEEASDDEDAENEEGEDEDWNEEAQAESSGEDLDDWDHPVRRLKIN